MSNEINDREQLEVKSKWFSVKLDAINGYTLAAMAMILTAMIIIVALLAPV
jgi:hypothetical protein